MHPEARSFLESHAEKFRQASRVIDVGGRDVNGTPRDLFSAAEVYTVVDVVDGDDVDVVIDAASGDWPFCEEFDFAVSTETFEHAEHWPEIVANMARSLIPGGSLVATAAADPRAPHSGIDGFTLREGEWYGNVDPHALAVELLKFFDKVHVMHHPHGDVYAIAEGRR